MISGGAVSGASVSGDYGPVVLGPIEVSLPHSAAADMVLIPATVFDVTLASAADLAGAFGSGKAVGVAMVDAALATFEVGVARAVSVLFLETAAAAGGYSTSADLQALFLDSVSAVAAAADGEAPTETWVFGVDSGGSTRYENFDFNSYAKIGPYYYGCKADGVYRLEGDTDAGAPIQAMVSFGKQNFGTSTLKRVTNAYVGVSGQGRLFLKVLVEGNEYTYAARSYDEHIQVQRFDTGRGLCANWLEFELYNANGEDFELASVEFVAVPTNRRI